MIRYYRPCHPEPYLRSLLRIGGALALRIASRRLVWVCDAFCCLRALRDMPGRAVVFCRRRCREAALRLCSAPAQLGVLASSRVRRGAPWLGLGFGFGFGFGLG